MGLIWPGVDRTFSRVDSDCMCGTPYSFRAYVKCRALQFKLRTWAERGRAAVAPSNSWCVVLSSVAVVIHYDGEGGKQMDSDIFSCARHWYGLFVESGVFRLSCPTDTISVERVTTVITCESALFLCLLNVAQNPFWCWFTCNLVWNRCVPQRNGDWRFLTWSPASTKRWRLCSHSRRNSEESQTVITVAGVGHVVLVL